MQNWHPLVEYQREGIAEVIKFGAIMAYVGDKALFQIGGDVLCFGRSLLKPYQMKVFTKALDKQLTPEQKALSLASHNAESHQLDIVHSMLEAPNDSFLHTPASMPLMPNEEITSPSPWNHPCSGKHAGIIRGCEINDWPKEDYQSLSHPYHHAFTQTIQRILGDDWQAQAVAFDGCGLPTYSHTLSELAQLFSALVIDRDKDWIWQSMTQFPELIGGQGRLDTKIMQACDKKVLAKEGADGLLGLAIDHADYPQGLGIVIKMAHGWDATATGLVAEAILSQLGFDVPPTPAPAGQKAVLDNALSEVFAMANNAK
ncbi:asparaginase [Alteromonas sp. a30]|uniref:asparaginase n=1 Tax=Alteromonas sp. a30 TaxID=2730917 RepID=UPI00227F9EA4|nr:asparaginase [Alteromonas sp. a30]MCY7295945.1 hypothetical protein [Alteromonas sp. a30]